MNYNIFGDKAPMAPTLGKGTECIKLLCSQASNDMISPLIPMFFPPWGRICAIRNFSIRTKLGRKRVV